MPTDASAAKAFEILMAKGEIATITLFNNHTFIHIDFLYLGVDYFRIVCCILMYCIWEEVNPFPRTTILHQTTLNIFCQKMENLYN